jgi:hypothetical protein
VNPRILAALSIISWQPVLQTTLRAEQPDRAHVAQAIELAAHYLESNCDENGKFTYLVDPVSGTVSPSYHAIRHAGAIYSLAMLNHSHPDRKAVDTMVRAAAYLRANYIGPDTASNAIALWAKPLPTPSYAELGGAGLGLVALTALNQAQPETVPLADLEGLGRFILFLQNDDGSFNEKYSPETGVDTDYDILYYPGEAALGLIGLYELDHHQEWLDAAGKALAYLVSSRAHFKNMPPDHWALIATARFLPYCQETGCPVSRAELIDHAARICDRILRDQVGSAPDTRRNGAFSTAGQTTSSATRLEGLLAALEFLPEDPGGRRDRIRSAVDRGIAFLLRAQIASGPYAGGVPGALSSATHASDIRIDYVQHAMSALLRYQAMFP